MVGKRSWSFFFLCFGVFMVYLDAMIVNVALPDIRSTMELGIRGLQWIVDAYAIPFACLLLAAGTVGDAIGHKKVFLFGMAGFTLSSVWCAVSPSIGWLLAGRALQGAFGALMIPVSLAVIRIMFESEAARAKAIGIWAGIGGLAVAAGPLAGGWLVETFGWQSVFWANVPIGAAVLVALLAVMKESGQQTRRSLDTLGQLLSMFGIAALAYGVIEGHTLGWGDWRIIGSLSASGVAFILFTLWEGRVRNPLLPLGLFRQPIFVTAIVVNFFGFFGLFAVVFLFTLYLQNVNGLSAVETGLHFLPLTAAIMVVSTAGSNLAAKISPRVLIPVGCLAVGAALFGLWTTDVGTSFGTYAGYLILLGIGVPIAGTSATVTLMSNIAPDRAGAASGIANTFRQISSVLAVALSGTIVSAHVRSSASSVMGSLSVPQDLQQSLAEAMSSGNIGPFASKDLTPDAVNQLSREAAHFFVGGMHTALAVAAIGTWIGGAVCLILLRKLPSRMKSVNPRNASAVPASASPMETSQG